MTGCNTTPAFFRKGKKSAFKQLLKDTELVAATSLESTKHRLWNRRVANIGEQFILKLNGATVSKSLDDLRYVLY